MNTSVQSNTTDNLDHHQKVFLAYLVKLDDGESTRHRVDAVINYSSDPALYKRLITAHRAEKVSGRQS